MYQILSQSVRFCTLYIKKHFGVFFFGSHCTCSSNALPHSVRKLNYLQLCDFLEHNIVNIICCISKKRHWCCTLYLQHTSTDFGNFWHRCCWQSVIKRFVIPLLLTNVCTTWRKMNMNPGKCVFSVTLYTVSRKRHCFGLLHLQHSSTDFNNFCRRIIKYSVQILFLV